MSQGEQVQLSSRGMSAWSSASSFGAKSRNPANVKTVSKMLAQRLRLNQRYMKAAIIPHTCGELGWIGAACLLTGTL